MSTNCFICKSVKPRHEALQCDVCFQWQHKSCEASNFSSRDRRACATQIIDWHCAFCEMSPHVLVNDAERTEKHRTPRNVQAEQTSDFTMIMGSLKLEDLDWPSIDVTSQENTTDILVDDNPFNRAMMASPVSSIAADNDHRTKDHRVNDHRVNDHRDFQIMEGSSQRGKQKLIDSYGFSYNVKRTRPDGTDWQCTSRPKDNPCKASVIQRSNGEFQIGRQHHNHASVANAALYAKIDARIRVEANTILHRPAREVVRKILREELSGAAYPGLRKRENLCRTVNRIRQRLRQVDSIRENCRQ